MFRIPTHNLFSNKFCPTFHFFAFVTVFAAISFYLYRLLCVHLVLILTFYEVLSFLYFINSKTYVVIQIVLYLFFIAYIYLTVYLPRSSSQNNKRSVYQTDSVLLSDLTP
jgi:hypothetical protein